MGSLPRDDQTRVPHPQPDVDYFATDHCLSVLTNARTFSISAGVSVRGSLTGSILLPGLQQPSVMLLRIKSSLFSWASLEPRCTSVAFTSLYILGTPAPSGAWHFWQNFTYKSFPAATSPLGFAWALEAPSLDRTGGAIITRA